MPGLRAARTCCHCVSANLSHFLCPVDKNLCHPLDAVCALSRLRCESDLPLHKSGKFVIPEALKRKATEP
jgi:hypothetical protein